MTQSKTILTPQSIASSAAPERAPREVYKDGKWVPGKAAPMPLPENLAALPSEITTRDMADPTKVYIDPQEEGKTLDPPHLVEEISDNYKELEHAKPQEKGEEEGLREVGGERLYARLSLRQELVDLVKFKVIGNILRNEIARMQADPHAMKLDLHIRHVWFARDDISSRELREGNPPPDSARPKHLRGLDLVVDPLNWPPSVVARLAKVGYTVPTLTDIWESIRALRAADGLDDNRIVLAKG